jgi:hypothetical protein
MTNPPPYRVAAAALVFVVGWVVTALSPAGAAPQQLTPTLPIDEVRIGMRGYGMTVFAGTEIEPFPVEVISIVRNSSPKHDVIWIRCPSDRMQKSGPVQGMSGSPIFLWPDTADGQTDKSHQIGEGGKLIGAFAFGFANAKDCLVGVQPIEYMRGVGQRARQQPSQPDQGDQPKRVQAGTARDTLGNVRQVSQRFARATHKNLHLDALEWLVSPRASGPAQASNGSAADGRPSAPLPAGKMDQTGRQRVQPLLLPMTVGSSKLARAAAPLLEPAGLTPVADEGLISGPPPASVQADRAALEPGGVLAIPMVFGDVSMAAAGTVTDVTPDGTVLGFGHAMFGRGQLTLPMATGYVHFIVPSRSTSFKTAAGLSLQGSLVQDEATAVAGVGDKRYRTVPVDVTVDIPGLGQRKYTYRVVHHPQITSALAGIVAQRSITAVHNLPAESTLRMKGTMHFTGDRPIDVDATLSGASASDVLTQIVPAAGLMMQNAHQRLAMERAEFHISVKRGIEQATLANARVDEVELAPGQTVNLTLRLQPYGKAVERKRIQFELPEDLPLGDYQLVVTDAAGYLQRYMKSRPHLATTTSIDDLYKTAQKLLSIKRDAIYVTLQLKEKGVAIGRDELPQLPSSRKAMLTSPTSTSAIPFVESVDKTIESPYVTQGELSFRLHVRKSDVARSQ